MPFRAATPIILGSILMSTPASAQRLDARAAQAIVAGCAAHSSAAQPKPRHRRGRSWRPARRRAADGRQQLRHHGLRSGQSAGVGRLGFADRRAWPKARGARPAMAMRRTSSRSRAAFRSSPLTVASGSAPSASPARRPPTMPLARKPESPRPDLGRAAPVDPDSRGLTIALPFKGARDEENLSRRRGRAGWAAVRRHDDLRRAASASAAFPSG